MEISLVTWPAMAVVTGAFLAVVALLVQIARRGTWLLSVRTILWTVLGTSGLALVLHASGLIPLDIPRWLYVIALLPFIGPAIGVAGWRSLHTPSCALAALCIPLGLLVALLIFNQHYQYWPTVGALLGKDHTDPMIDAPTALRLAASDEPLTTALPVSARSTTVAPTRGRLVDISIPGTVSGFRARAARVWLPPAFLTDPDRPRPVIELIGGTPSWTSDWTRSANLDTIADTFAAANGGEAPLIVMVDANGDAFGDTECVGKAETYLSTDVPNFMVAHFGAPADRAAWGVGGYSEGGTCAVTLALRHSDQFAAFADLAGDSHPDVGGHHRTVHKLFGGSEADFAAHDPATLLSQRPYPQLAGWFGSGHSDGSPRRHTTQLAAAARADGMAVQEYSGPGGHDYGFVGKAMEQALPWLSQQLHVPTAGASTPSAGGAGEVALAVPS
jgi:S-formylglutathione hydrolase FrmB